MKFLVVEKSKPCKIHRTMCTGFGVAWFYGISIFTKPSARAGYDTRSIFKQSLTGLNSEFSFSFTKAEEPSLPYYLPIAGGRIIGFIPFPRVLVLCEMLSVLSRIWTHVTVSISYDDNHYTTGTSFYGISTIVDYKYQIWFIYIYIYIYIRYIWLSNISQQS